MHSPSLDKKILIADDDQEALNLIARSLTRHGFAVTAVANGKEAQNSLAREQFDIVILDLMMPRMDGWEVLRWLRTEARSKTPVIILSAKDEMDDMQKGMSLQADTYLTKPIDIEELLQTIHTLLFLECGDSSAR